MSTNNSVVLIKTPKAGSTSVRDSLVKSNFCTTEEILNVPTHLLHTVNEEHKYKLSVHHINYDDDNIAHLNRIMQGEIDYIACIREPLARSISHYYYSLHGKKYTDYWDFYSKCSELEGTKAGWRGIDTTNNFMSLYLGFRDIEEITRENLLSRFKFVVVIEKYKEAITRLTEILLPPHPLLTLHNNKGRHRPLDLTFNQDIADLFYSKNLLDLKLYELCSEIYYT